MNKYRCAASGVQLPAEIIEAVSSWEARKAYAARHSIPVHYCIAIRIKE